MRSSEWVENCDREEQYMGYGELAGEKKELLFTEMKKTTRNRVRVRVSMGKISSSVLDRLTLGAHYTYECTVIE